MLDAVVESDHERMMVIEVMSRNRTGREVDVDVQTESVQQQQLEATMERRAQGISLRGGSAGCYKS